MNNLDWTDYFDKKELVEYSKAIIDELIQSIHSRMLPVFSKHNLTVDELGILLRWPIYFAVNTFIERLIRSMYLIEINAEKYYPSMNYAPRYFRNVAEAASAYYNDIVMNEKLMNDIRLSINKDNNSFKTQAVELPELENVKISLFGRGNTSIFEDACVCVCLCV